MAYLNGRLPNAVLAKIQGGRLRWDAARAFNAMNAESEARFGVQLHPTGGMSSYRTIAQQRYLYKLYEEGKGNLAAKPGTSNHGWGLAVDLATPQMRHIVDIIGGKYGFAKKWSDAPTEWWHIRWRRGRWQRKAPYGYGTIHPGYKGFPVWQMKKMMRKKGLRGFGMSRAYGREAEAAIKRFQARNHLKADGIVGPQTWQLLAK